MPGRTRNPGLPESGNQFIILYTLCLIILNCFRLKADFIAEPIWISQR
jgi:hypothetical protein